MQQHSGEGSEQNSCNNNWGLIWMANLPQLLYFTKRLIMLIIDIYLLDANDGWILKI
jgi:hypothetical protein